MLGRLKGDRICLEEIHRFRNEPVSVRGRLYWDILWLYNNVLQGLRKYVAQYGNSLASMGIDSWSVDFGLLASDGTLLQNPVHYRDRRAILRTDQRQPYTTVGSSDSPTGVRSVRGFGFALGYYACPH